MRLVPSRKKVFGLGDCVAFVLDIAVSSALFGLECQVAHLHKNSPDEIPISHTEN